mgnify:CR=1 FL=1
MMPEMDGIETCDRMRKIPELSNTMIAFLTARGEDYSQVAGFDAGADDFLFAPLEPVLLLSKLSSMQRISALNHEMQGMVSQLHREQEIAEQVFNRAVQMVIEPYFSILEVNS